MPKIYRNGKMYGSYGVSSPSSSNIGNGETVSNIYFKGGSVIWQHSVNTMVVSFKDVELVSDMSSGSLFAFSASGYFGTPIADVTSVLHSDNGSYIRVIFNSSNRRIGFNNLSGNDIPANSKLSGQLVYIYK